MYTYVLRIDISFIPIALLIIHGVHIFIYQSIIIFLCKVKADFAFYVFGNQLHLLTP